MDTSAQLLTIATQAGPDTIAPTDHDTMIGWDKTATAAAGTDVSLVQDVEISYSSPGITVYLLAYLFDPVSPGLIDNFRHTREGHETRVARMAENLSADYLIMLDDMFAFTPEGNSVGRSHIADALIIADAFPDRNAAFVQTLHPSGPYYVRYWVSDPAETVRCMRKARRMPVLAHPRACKHQRLLSEAVIADMAEAGLFDIERDHHDHVPEDRTDAECIAREMGLAMSGSFNYHGMGKSNRIGENTMDPRVIVEITARGVAEVVEL